MSGTVARMRHAVRRRLVDPAAVSEIAALRAELAAERAAAAAERAAAAAERVHVRRLIADVHTVVERSEIAAASRAQPPERQSERDLYLSLGELARRHGHVGAAPTPLAGAPGELTGHELRVFSQNGEDGVLAEILLRVGAPTRQFVEFGIESGREGNCVALADIAGWSGLFLEADDALHAELAGKYAAADAVQTVRALVTPGNVEELFAQAGVPDEPDVLSIDVDGPDYWIWEAIERYRPRVVVAEYNACLDPGRRLVQPREHAGGWQGDDYYGASLGALTELGGRKGYRLVHTELCAVNAFYVREDLAAGAFSRTPPIRGAPNFFHRGIRHPGRVPPGRYLDLDSGELVTSDRSS